MNVKIMLSIAIFQFMALCYSSAQSNNVAQKATKETSLKSVVVSGYVNDWILDMKRNTYNGFYLQANSGQLMIMFPEHMANELRQTIKIGNTLTVNGLETKDSLGVIKINLESVTIDGTTITVSPPYLPGMAPANENVTGTAKIMELQKHISGKITGYILDNKTILRLGPNIVNELSKRLVIGTTITYAGIKSATGSGEDAWATYTVILCKTITIDGKEYLTQ